MMDEKSIYADFQRYQDLSGDDREALLVRWRAWSSQQLQETLDRLGRNRHSVNLQIGTGRNPLVGWINSDVAPQNPTSVFLDAKQPMPISSATVDSIFSEHMLEHLTLEEGKGFLAECRRVLRPGGIIRVSTPNLSQIVSLWFDSGEGIDQYLDWAIMWNRLPSHENRRCIVINNFMRAWGHKFIYDKPTLLFVLGTSGFRNIV